MPGRQRERFLVRADRVLGVSHVRVRHAQVVVGLEGVGIELEGTLEGPYRFLESTGALEHVADADEEERLGVVDGQGLGKQANRLVEPALVTPDLGELGESGDRVGIDLERSLDEVLRTVRTSITLVDGGDVDERVGVVRVQLQGLLELRQRALRLAVLQVYATQTVVLLGRGRDLGGFGGLRALVSEVTQRAQSVLELGDVLRVCGCRGGGTGGRASILLVGARVGDRVPTEEAFLEDTLEHLAVHVLPDRESEVVQERRSDVEDRGAFELDASGPQVRTRGDEDAVRLVVEVRATHIGLGIHPHVYRIVADRLAQSRE